MIQVDDDWKKYKSHTIPAELYRLRRVLK